MKSMVFALLFFSVNLVFADEKNCNIFISQNEIHEHVIARRKTISDSTPFLVPAKRILEAKGYTLVDDCKAASMEIFGVGLRAGIDEYQSRLTISNIKNCKESVTEDFLFEATYRYDGFNRWLDNAFNKLFETLDEKFPTCEAQTFKPPEKPWF